MFQWKVQIVFWIHVYSQFNSTSRGESEKKRAPLTWAASGRVTREPSIKGWRWKTPWNVPNIWKIYIEIGAVYSKQTQCDWAARINPDALGYPDIWRKLPGFRPDLAKNQPAFCPDFYKNDPGWRNKSHCRLPGIDSSFKGSSFSILNQFQLQKWWWGGTWPPCKALIRDIIKKRNIQIKRVVHSKRRWGGNWPPCKALKRVFCSRGEIGPLQSSNK